MAAIHDNTWIAGSCDCGCGLPSLFVCGACRAKFYHAEDHHKKDWPNHCCTKTTRSRASSSGSGAPLQFKLGDRVYADFEEELQPAVVLLEEAGVSPIGAPEYWYFVHFEGKSGDFDCWQPAISLVPRNDLFKIKMQMIAVLQQARQTAETAASQGASSSTASSTSLTLDQVSQNTPDPNVLQCHDSLFTPNAESSCESYERINRVVFCEHNNELQCATILGKDSWIQSDQPDAQPVTHFYLRYDGCSDRWNEWVNASKPFLDISIEELAALAQGLQDIQVDILYAELANLLQPGDLCLCKHTDGFFYRAVILVNDLSLTVDRTASFHYRIHFLGMPDDSDCWVLADQIYRWTPAHHRRAAAINNALKRRRRPKLASPTLVPLTPSDEFQPQYQPSTAQPALFSRGDRIFAEFHSQPYRAKVLFVDTWQVEQAAEPTIFFYIRYKGWSSRWCEWIDASLAEPWSAGKYAVMPPPAPLVRIFPAAVPQPLYFPPRPSLQLPYASGLPRLHNLGEAIKYQLWLSLRPQLGPPVRPESIETYCLSPTFFWYLCLRMGVEPSFPVLQHWLNDIVSQLIMSNPNNTALADLSFSLLLKSVQLDQAPAVAAIFTNITLLALLQKHGEATIPAWMADFSQGSATVPIPVINMRQRSLPEGSFTPTIRYPSVDLSFLPACSCRICVPATCSCSSESYHKFAYDSDGRLSASFFRNSSPIFECNMLCACSDACQNRVVQHGSLIPTMIFSTRDKGWGLLTLVDIPKGTFVLECIGEVIDHDEAERRGQQYDLLKQSYLFDLDQECAYDICKYTIDMAVDGNHARFINHSCNPNLVSFPVWIENQDKDLPHIALFASRPIWRGEELTMDYRYPSTQQIVCKCGSKLCRKFLY